jgi:hypothetical protein
MQHNWYWRNYAIGVSVYFKKLDGCVLLLGFHETGHGLLFEFGAFGETVRLIVNGVRGELKRK